MNVHVLINMIDGKVTITINGVGDDGDFSYETVLQWYRVGSESEKCGFIVKKDSIGMFDFPASFITISEVASEIFLNTYVQMIAHKCDVDDEAVTYEADGGMSLKRAVFLPPTVDDDEMIQEFPVMQNDLINIWLNYINEGRITEEHIDEAQDAELLFDFLSLINVERLFLVSRKDMKGN